MKSSMTEYLISSLSMNLTDANGDGSLEQFVLDSFRSDQKQKGVEESDIFLLYAAAKVLSDARRKHLAELEKSLDLDPEVGVQGA